MPKKLGLACAYGLALWLVGMVWGSVIFAIPSLKDWGEIPYVSKNLAISVPILIAWLVLTPLFARRYLRAAAEGESERAGYMLGQIWMTVVAMLDFVVIVWLLDGGDDFYYYALIWVAYGILFVVPWMIGRKMAAGAAA